MPVEVAPDEVIVRAIRTLYHYDKNKRRLKSAAFRPKAERDDVSVMRKRHLGNDGCKDKAVEIAKKAYIGLAALRAEEIAAAKARVVDSREGFYLGHAHIAQGTPAPPSGQTADPDLIERWKALADTARYYQDGEPQTNGWHGPDIV
ncbi:MAG: hypothetical protein ACREPL_03660 [Rhodanobacteraceae bacterium]